MRNPQGFLQVLADVPERSGPSGSSDCFVATFNANSAKGLRIIFQGDRGRGTQNALAWMPMEGEPANKTCRLTSK